MSILHWAKFFDKGLDKDKDEKEGLFMRLKYIEEINKELPNTLSKAIKAGKTTKNESDFYYDSRCDFCKFNRGFKRFIEMVSLESKRSDLIDLYKLFSDFKDFEFPDDTKKPRKNEVMNNTNQLIS